MNKPWTEQELAALVRNYQQHGTLVGRWDEPIGRERKAIRDKARRMGIPYKGRYESVLSDADRRRLEYVCEQLCERFDVPMRTLSREISEIACEVRL